MGQARERGTRGCAGLTLGICANDFDAFWSDAEQKYFLWAKRLSERDWKDVGHHAVRRCRITDCGQAGICGAYGGAFSTIEDCDISYCYWKKPYYGQEMGCIKLHAAIDVTIARCRLHHSGTYGIWFDWMAQGTRIVGNRMWANGSSDIYLEVNHGPILIKGNDMLSEFVNNILGGNPRLKNEVHPNETSAFTRGKNKIDFADGATVSIRLGDRRASSGGQLIAWASEPANVAFKRAEGERRYCLVKKSDGLYLQSGFVLIVK